MLLNDVPRLVGGHLFALCAATRMFLVRGVEHAAVGERLDRVIVVHFLVFIRKRGEVGAWRGIAGGDGARDCGRVSACCAEDFVFGAGACEGGFQAFVVGLERVGA